MSLHLPLDCIHKNLRSVQQRVYIHTHIDKGSTSWLDIVPGWKKKRQHNLKKVFQMEEFKHSVTSSNLATKNKFLSFIVPGLTVKQGTWQVSYHQELTGEVWQAITFHQWKRILICTGPDNRGYLKTDIKEGNSPEVSYRIKRQACRSW